MITVLIMKLMMMMMMVVIVMVMMVVMVMVMMMVMPERRCGKIGEVGLYGVSVMAPSDREICEERPTILHSNRNTKNAWSFCSVILSQRIQKFLKILELL